MGFMISTISLPGTNYTAHGQNGSTAKKFTMIFFNFHTAAMLKRCCMFAATGLRLDICQEMLLFSQK